MNKMIKSIKNCVSLILFGNFCALMIFKLSPEPTSMYYVPTGKFEDAPYAQWDSSMQWERIRANLTLSNTLNSIENDDDYCKKVSEYRRKNPIKFDKRGLPVKRDRIFYTNYGKKQLVREILEKHGNLVHKDHGGAEKSLPSITLDPAITFFYLRTSSWHKYHLIGKHYLCEGQRYNHIPGNIWLNYKDVAVDNLRNYAEHYEGREHCFNPWEILPFTYNLVYEDQCLEFLETLQDELDTNEIRWMVKKSRNSHGGKGVYVVDSEYAQEMIEEFECPSKKRMIAQSYIKNPMLIDGRKFDFRVYLFVASMDPLIILFGNGFIRLSLEQYDPESSDRSIHLTNTKVAKEKLNDMSADEKEEILSDQSWSLEQLEEYMIQKGLAKIGWLEDNVKPFLKKMMFHLVRMNLDKLLRHPGIYELFGLDFLMDENLHLWFLEANLTPAMGRGNKMRDRLYNKVLEDVLNVEFALQYGADLDKIMEETDLEWIFDGRKAGYERYHNILSSDCI